ncbi:MAG: hypothetical protein ACM3Q1_18010 [Bacteroidales bacterium]
MLSAPPLDLTILPPPRKARWVPLGLSVLLHVLLALVWLGFPVPQDDHPAERPMEVELAAEMPRPAPAPASGGEQKAKPATAAEQGAPIPQLEAGILAQRSSTPKLKPQPGPFAPPQPRTEIAPKPKKPEPVTQNERDFVLGQVMRHWQPPRELSAYERADIRVSVMVRADGYFEDIYDGRRPWNPAEVFDGYNSLPPQDIQRRTVDAFYRAIRQAQPVKLAPLLKEKAPFAVRLDFRFRDAR